MAALSKICVEEVLCAIISGASESSYFSQSIHLENKYRSKYWRSSHFIHQKFMQLKAAILTCLVQKLVNGEFFEQCIKAFKKEISALIHKKT